MPFKERLKIFIIGAVLGSLLVSFIFYQRGFGDHKSEAEHADMALQQAIDGVAKAYASRIEPLQSRFLAEEVFEDTSIPLQQRRTFVIRGQLPGQELRIEELLESDESGQYHRVVDWSVLSPNQMLITLKPQLKPATLSKELKQWGYRFVGKTEIPDCYVIQLGDSSIAAIDTAKERIGGMDLGVVSVEPMVYLAMQ